MHENILIGNHTSAMWLIILNGIKNQGNRLAQEAKQAKTNHEYNLVLLRLAAQCDKTIETKQHLLENAKQSRIQITRKMRELSNTLDNLDELKTSVFENEDFARRENVITRAYELAYRFYNR